ncbi:cyclic nucleotide-binding domain-containing protein [Nocardioides bigeumensis]|uniref:Cyclic nucleotide-binding domain-containing protein n=1 Tax=Nocardioides bigeumensis TaxID=433657 RepID=A0ABP5K023_9ACTN
MRTDDLRSIPLFEGITDDQLAAVASRFTEVEVDTGTVLARRGDFGYHFFLVRSGLAVVAVDERVLTTLGPGDSFGEIGVLRRGKRTANVVAVTEMRLATMTIWDFNEITREVPEIVERARKVAEERLARG